VVAEEGVDAVEVDPAGRGAVPCAAAALVTSSVIAAAGSHPLWVRGTAATVPVLATLLPVKVWIDQDLCTGDGLCTDHAPAVFTLLEDGIAYVKDAGRVQNDPGGARSPAPVPSALEGHVVAAADDCPGECIFIEWTGPALRAEAAREPKRAR
jgi:ferredoxin